MFKRFLLLALFAMAASAQTLQIPVGTFNPPLTTIRNGTGAPPNSLGNNGDWYIDTAAKELYGPKAAGVWPTPGLPLTGAPMKNGLLSARPETCGVPDIYFATDVTPGNNLYLCTAVNTWTQVAGTGGSWGSITGLLSAQTDLQAALDAKMSNPMIAPGDLIIGGSLGSPERLAAGTTDGTCLEMTSGSPAWGPCGGAAASIQSGLLAALPTSCAAGDVYFATDQPKGQQLYQCSAADTWTQSLLLGGSGALQLVDGALDINPDVVPQKGTANIFTAYNTFEDGLSLLTTETKPACSSSNPGLEWFTHDGVSADSFQICEFDGSAYGWANSGSTSGGGITALTGDVTASGTGSVPATLATVNSAPGECGDGTHVCQVTTDGKGRVTNQTVVAISEPGGSIVNASDYNWSQTPGGSLTAATAATVTLAPCPVGVNGTDANLWVYLSGGTGTAEAAEVSGGTCTSGAASGTVQFTPANSHTGAWTISSATAGIYEAVMGNQWRKVYIPAGHYVMHACMTFDINANNRMALTLVGDSHDGALLTNGTLLDFSNLSCDAITIENTRTNGVVLKDFAMMGTGAAGGGNGLVFTGGSAGSGDTGSTRVILSNIVVSNFSKDCVYSNNAYEFTAENMSAFSNCGQWGMELVGLQNWDLIDHVAFGSNSALGSYGNLKVDGTDTQGNSSVLTVRDSDIESSAGALWTGATITGHAPGLYIANFHTVVVQGNFIEDNDVAEGAAQNVVYGTGVTSLTEIGNYIHGGTITYGSDAASTQIVSYGNRFSGGYGATTGRSLPSAAGSVASGGVGVADGWYFGPDEWVAPFTKGPEGSSRYGAVPSMSHPFDYNRTSSETLSLTCNGGVCPTGLYQVNGYAWTMSAGTAGTLSLNLAFDDPGTNMAGGNAHTITLGAPLDLTSITAYTQGQATVWLDGVNTPTITAAETGVTGTPVFGFGINLMRLW